MPLPTLSVLDSGGATQTRNSLPNAAATTAEADRVTGDNAVPSHMSAQDANLFKAIIGQAADTAVTNPALSASLIALAKGMLTNQTTLGAQTTKINDGTNTAAVKAASTAPVAADPAMVVAISPNGGSVSATLNALANSTLPTGSDFPVTPSVPLVLAYPSSQTFTATGTSQYTIEPGATYLLSLTNAPAATTTWVGTVAFQWSPDGLSWNNGTAIPLSSLPGAGKVNVASATAVGLWLWEAPITAQFFRYNCNAYTSGTIWSFVEPFLPGVSIPMPWTPTVTSGQTIMPFVDANLFAEIGVQVSAVTTTVATPQGTNDPTGTVVNALGFKDSTANTTTGGTTIAAATPNAVFSPAGHKWMRLQCTTTGTVFTIQGITGLIGSQALVTAGYTNGAFMSANNASFNLGQVGATATVNGGLAGTLAVGGAAAHSAATTTNPVTVGGRVLPTTTATVDATLVANDASHLPITTGYSVAVKPFGTAELDWAAITSLTPTVWASAATLTQVRPASGTANVRTYITSMQLETDALGGATSLWLVDGPVAIASATVATPGVFTSGTHDFKVGDAVVLQGITGLTITGIAANQVCYVATVPSATTFTLSTTPGGSGVQVTVTGTATIYRILRQVRLQTAALAGDRVLFNSPIRSAPNVAISLLCSATQTGTVYANTQGYYGF